MGNNKPSVIKAILFSLLSGIIFYLLCTIIGFILILIYALLKVIPIISNLIDVFFAAQDNSPKLAIPYLYLALSYYFTSIIIDRIVKSIATRKLTFIILGWSVIALNILWFIENILGGGGSWGVNIGYIIAGIVFITRSRKCKPKEPSKYTYSQTPSITNEESTEDSSSENYYYMEAANGMTVRVPESKLEQWQEEQDRIRRGEHTEKSEVSKQALDRVLQRLYHPEDNNES